MLRNELKEQEPEQQEHRPDGEPMGRENYFLRNCKTNFPRIEETEEEETTYCGVLCAP